MKNIFTALLIILALQGLSLPSFAGDNMGFWWHKEWGAGKGREIDRALAEFIQVKEKWALCLLFKGAEALQGLCKKSMCLLLI